MTAFRTSDDALKSRRHRVPVRHAPGADGRTACGTKRTPFVAVVLNPERVECAKCLREGRAS